MAGTTTGTCCGRSLQRVELGTAVAADGGGAHVAAVGGAGVTTLLRCPSCQRREWRVAGRPVPAEQALTALGEVFRDGPRRARAARDRAASGRAARTAARVAAAAATAPGAAPPASTAAAPVDRAVDRGADRVRQEAARRAELGRLLEGWTVLSA